MKILQINKLIYRALLVFLPVGSMALNLGDTIEVVTGVFKSEDTNVVVFKVTDDNPRLIDALESYFEKKGMKPNNPKLKCMYCSPTLGMHIFKILNDNPKMIVKVERIIKMYSN